MDIDARPLRRRQPAQTTAQVVSTRRGNRIFNWLNSVGLGQYFSNFVAAGIDEEQLPKLTMQDYDKVGVSSLQERKKLFTLIQHIRSGQAPNGEGGGAGSGAGGEPSTPDLTVMNAKSSSRDGGEKPNQKGSQKRYQKQQIPQPPPSQSQSQIKPKNTKGRAKVKTSSSLSSDGGDRNSEANTVTAPAPVESEKRTNLDAFGRIMVCVRKRPINRKELDSEQTDIIQVKEDHVAISEPKSKVDGTKYIDLTAFRFDQAFDIPVDNPGLYKQCAAPLIDLVFKGGMATCFAYGQTGSGKTYTMLGDERNPDVHGIYVLAAHDIFKMLKRKEYRHLVVWVSFYEIYGGKLFDLLNERKLLHAREDANHKVQVVGLQERCVEGADAVSSLIELIAHGNTVRSTGSTGVNADSSRSHAILQICLKDTGSKKAKGMISFIDLAGSERAADTMSNDRQTRMEGAEINKSLLALKECIRALDQGADHIPFRGSKLTQVLRDSFINSNARTVMIANISPNSGACEHTLNTLRYADRVKELRKDKRDRDGGVKFDAYMPHMAPKQASQQAVQPPAQSQPQPRRARSPNPYVSPGKAAVPVPKKKPPVFKKRPSAPAPASASALARKDRDKRRAERNPEPESEEEEENNDNEDENEVEIEMADSQDLAIRHEDLVSEILEEEEDIILCHRQQIDDMMLFIKEEMDLLNDVDQPGASVDDYVLALSKILRKKRDEVSRLMSRLDVFRNRLKEEEVLSTSMKAGSKLF